jgi:hypothetical protein
MGQQPTRAVSTALVGSRARTLRETRCSIADGTFASDRCPAGFYTHGMGGGGGITDGGPSWLREIAPHTT